MLLFYQTSIFRVFKGCQNNDFDGEIPLIFFSRTVSFELKGVQLELEYYMMETNGLYRWDVFVCLFQCDSDVGGGGGNPQLLMSAHSLEILEPTHIENDPFFSSL